MIEHKSKKCKGTGQAKGHGCGTETMHRVYGLCKSKCYPNWLLNTDAGKIKMEKARLKASKPRRDFEKMEKDIKLSKSLPQALIATQKVFNKFIRLRDKYKPCISENTSWKSDHDAGHCFSVKQYSELRFNEDNCHGQSIGGNRFKEGNVEDYLTNLPNRIGEDKFKELLERARVSKQREYHWSLEELSKIRIKFKQKIKDLS